MFKANPFFKANLIFAFLMSAGALAWAQSGARSDAVRSQPGQNHGRAATKSPGAAKSCAEFGPGFVRAEGSDTCIRIGGSIGIGVGGGSGRSGSLR